MKHTTRLSLGLVGSLLASTVGCSGEGPAAPVAAAAAEGGAANALAAAEGGPSFHLPLLTRRQSDSASLFVPVPVNQFCAVLGCDDEELDRFPLFPAGQRLDLAALVELGPGTTNAVEVRLRRNVGSGASDTLITGLNQMGCTHPTFCRDGALDLLAVGPGFHELEIDTTVPTGAGENTNADSYPLRVLSFTDALSLAQAWVETADARDPTNLGLLLDPVSAHLDYAEHLFELNPVAAFALTDEANELLLAATDSFVTTDLDTAIDLLARTRFFTGRALVQTTIALRPATGSVDLLSGDVIDGISQLGLTFSASAPTAERGNTGAGSLVTDSCPAGEVAVGFNGQLGASIDGLALVCGTVVVDASTGAVTIEGGTTRPLRGRTNSPASTRCPADQMMVGFDGRSGTLIDNIELRCVSLAVSSGAVQASAPTTVAPMGGGGGGAFEIADCAAGQVATGAIMRVDALVRALALQCSAVAVQGEVVLEDFAIVSGLETSLATLDAVADDLAAQDRDNADALLLAPDPAELLNLANTQILNGTFVALLDNNADAVPALRRAAMFDGDDIMAALVGRLPLALTTNPGRMRRIYDNDADEIVGERAFGRFVLAAVRDSVADTLLVEDNGLLSGAARTSLQNASNSLGVVAAAMAAFPEGFNVSPRPTGQIGANQRLMSEVYLASQATLEELRTVQSSTIDTTAWQAGIAVGLNSVSRFSAFTGSRPLSGFRDVTDAAASFECRFGKALFYLQDGDHDAANAIFVRSRCQLLDVYNEHYATGTLTDPERIPDDGCIAPAAANCPTFIGPGFANGCARVDQGPNLQSLALDPGWDPSLASNCGVGSIYNPDPVTLPLGGAPLSLPNRNVEPEPYCFGFSYGGGPLLVRTVGDCEIGGEDTELFLFGDGVTVGPVNSSNPSGSLCDTLSQEALAPGSYVACVGNRSATSPISGSALTISVEEPCRPGTNPQENCAPCFPGLFCAGGDSPPVFCEALEPPRVDGDFNPATPCVPRIASLFTIGDDGGDRPIDGAEQDAVYDLGGNLYVLSTWIGVTTIGPLVDLIGDSGSGAVMKFDPFGELLWVAHFARTEGFAVPQRLAVNDRGQVFVAGRNTRFSPGLEPEVRQFDLRSATPTVPVATTKVTGENTVFIVSIDSGNGAVQWTQSLGNEPDARVGGLAVDAAGDPVVQAYDSFIGHLEGSSGIVISTHEFAVPGSPVVADGLAVLRNGDYVISGTLRGPATIFGSDLVFTGSKAGFVATMLPGGVEIGARTIGGTESDELFDIKPARDGGYYVAGRYQTQTEIEGRSFSVAEGNFGFLVAHIRSDDSFGWVSAQSGTGTPGPAVGIRRLAVDGASGFFVSETVRFAGVMAAGDLFGTSSSFFFGSTSMPFAGPGLVNLGLRDVSLAGDSGRVTALRSYQGSNLAPMQFTGIAIDPFTRRAAVVGFGGAVTIDDRAFNTVGDFDQFILRLAY